MLFKCTVCNAVADEISRKCNWLSMSSFTEKPSHAPLSKRCASKDMATLISEEEIMKILAGMDIPEECRCIP